MNEFTGASLLRILDGQLFRRSAQDPTVPALWSLIVVYIGARFLQIFPGKVPMVGVVAFHVLPPLAFAVIHGARRHRLRGVLIFVGLFLVIGNLFEGFSLRTGFPFGHYYFTDLMGPQLLQVPIFLGLAYVGMAYLSWCLSNTILGTEARLAGSKVLFVPLLASLIMTSWDLSQDAIWSTYLHLWIWPRGGIYFGVPISNFFGWFFTVYVIYQCFALYVHRHAVEPPRGSGKLPIVFYAICAAGNLLPVSRAGNSVISDPSGALWKVRDITVAAAFVSVFVMGSFAVWAALKLPGANRKNAQARSFSAA